MSASKPLYSILAERIHAMSVGVERHGDIQLKANFALWVSIFVESLREQNHSFKPERFIKACKLNPMDEDFLLEKFNVGR